MISRVLEGSWDEEVDLNDRKSEEQIGTPFTLGTRKQRKFSVHTARMVPCPDEVECNEKNQQASRHARKHMSRPSNEDPS